MPSSRKTLAVLLTAAVVTAAIWANASLGGRDTLSLTFLDVGEGLCAVMRTPSGRTMVVDCGTSSWRDDDSIGEKVAVPYLQSLGVDTIDVAVMTHPHSDHVSGYAGLLEAKPARLVLDLGVRYPSPYYERFLKTVKSSGAKYRRARRGQTLDMGDGVSVQVLSPSPAETYTDLNNGSIVLRITYKKAAFLLASDAEAPAEQPMLKSGAPLQAQVLQVGHHGSKDSSSKEWLNVVRPQIAVISCGRRNDYGHPSRDTIRRLAAFGARVYRTDRDGAIRITTDGDMIRVTKTKDW